MSKQKGFDWRCGFTRGEFKNLLREDFVPKPKSTEDMDEFISRGMGDDELVESFPDNEQRSAICHNIWQGRNMAEHPDDPKKKKRKKLGENPAKRKRGYQEANDTFEIPVEIFSTGLWNGMEFTKGDLMQIASAFHALVDVHDVPLKFGHNPEQEMTDGQPALGWVADVWVTGDELMAQFVGMPEIVFEAIKKELYKHVSIELDMGVEHQGRHFPLVLSGVALLGADIPAVNTLEDLTAFMSRDEGIKVEKRVAFTAISIEGDDSMSKELEAKIAALQKTVEGLITGKTESDTKIIEFKAKEKARLVVEQAAKFAAAKTAMVASLEQLVKDEKITPAQRDIFIADWKDEDETLTRLEFALKMLGGNAEEKVQMKKDEKGNRVTEKDKEDQRRRVEEPDDVLLAKINTMQAEHPKLSFTAAKNLVMRADLDLVRNYVMMNGELSDDAVRPKHV